MNKSSIALLIGAGVVLILAFVYAWQLSTELGSVDIGVHGWIAMILGVVFTLALGMGLMFLVFYSHRKGYDDRIEPK